MILLTALHTEKWRVKENATSIRLVLHVSHEGLVLVTYEVSS